MPHKCEAESKSRGELFPYPGIYRCLGRDLSLHPSTSAYYIHTTAIWLYTGTSRHLDMKIYLRRLSKHSQAHLLICWRDTLFRPCDSSRNLFASKLPCVDCVLYGTPRSIDLVQVRQYTHTHTVSPALFFSRSFISFFSISLSELYHQRGTMELGQTFIVAAPWQQHFLKNICQPDIFMKLLTVLLTSYTVPNEVWTWVTPIQVNYL